MKEVPVSLVLDEQGRLNDIRTYMYHDGPLSFLVENNGRLFYFHFYDFDQENKIETFLVREGTKEEIESLEVDQIDLLTFFKTASTLHMFKSASECKLFLIDIKDVEDELPKKGVFLYKEDREV